MVNHPNRGGAAGAPPPESRLSRVDYPALVAHRRWIEDGLAEMGMIDRIPQRLAIVRACLANARPDDEMRDTWEARERQLLAAQP